MTMPKPALLWLKYGDGWVPAAGDADGKLLVSGVGGTVVKTFTWVISSPAVGGVLGPRLRSAMTVTRIDAYVRAATSVTFNIEERSTIGSAGTNILSSDMAADVNGETATSFADPDLAAGNWLYLDISAVSGTPGQVVVTLSCTVP